MFVLQIFLIRSGVKDVGTLWKRWKRIFFFISLNIYLKHQNRWHVCDSVIQEDRSCSRRRQDVRRRWPWLQSLLSSARSCRRGNMSSRGVVWLLGKPSLIFFFFSFFFAAGYFRCDTCSFHFVSFSGAADNPSSREEIQRTCMSIVCLL